MSFFFCRLWQAWLSYYKGICFLQVTTSFELHAPKELPGTTVDHGWLGNDNCMELKIQLNRLKFGQHDGYLVP